MHVRVYCTMYKNSRLSVYNVVVFVARKVQSAPLNGMSLLSIYSDPLLPECVQLVSLATPSQC